MAMPVSKHLGTELHLATGYMVNTFTQAVFGVSYMLASQSIEYAKT